MEPYVITDIGFQISSSPNYIKSSFKNHFRNGLNNFKTLITLAANEIQAKDFNIEEKVTSIMSMFCVIRKTIEDSEADALAHLLQKEQEHEHELLIMSQTRLPVGPVQFHTKENGNEVNTVYCLKSATEKLKPQNIEYRNNSSLNIVKKYCRLSGNLENRTGVIKYLNFYS